MNIFKSNFAAIGQHGRQDAVVEADGPTIRAAYDSGLPQLAHMLSMQVLSDLASHSPECARIADLLKASASSGNSAALEQALSEARHVLSEAVPQHHVTDIINDLKVATICVAKMERAQARAQREARADVDIVVAQPARSPGGAPSPPNTPFAQPPPPQRVHQFVNWSAAMPGHAPAAEGRAARVAWSSNARRERSLNSLFVKTAGLPDAVRLFVRTRADEVLTQARRKKTNVAREARVMWLALSYREQVPYIERAGVKGLDQL